MLACPNHNCIFICHSSAIFYEPYCTQIQVYIVQVYIVANSEGAVRLEVIFVSDEFSHRSHTNIYFCMLSSKHRRRLNSEHDSTCSAIAIQTNFIFYS